MPTFAELLTKYMARTGISDSELARSLGVRRQTIFRWKEGLVERPRHREDVIRCAARLRLTRRELDQLLLAAGFPPESPTLPAGSTLAETARAAEPQREAGGPSPEERPAPAPRPGPAIPKVAWRLLAVLLSLMIAVTGMLVWILLTRTTTDYPVAVPGEALIVIAPLTDRDGRPVSGRPVVSDFGARLKAALEREIHAARLSEVRVGDWPTPIADEKGAAAAVRQAKAVVVLSGTSDSGSATISLTASLTAASAGSPLDALLAPPSRLVAVVASDSAAEARALALLTLSLVYTTRGDLDLARAVLTQVVSQPMEDRNALAMSYLALGYVHQLARPPRLDEAITAYGQALSIDETPAAYQNRGLARLRQSDTAGWQADLGRVLALETQNALLPQALCWAYALDHYPEQALPYCDKAVKAESSGYGREARGLVYAELSRLPEAAAEMRRFAEWLGRQPQDVRDRQGPLVAEWVKALEQGSNPVDPAVLDRLRRQ